MSDTPLSKQLRELHWLRKRHHDGAGGQQCGMESWRIVASGERMQCLQDAADHIDALERRLRQAEGRASGWIEIDAGTLLPRMNERLLAVVAGEVRIIAWGKTSHVPMYGWCLADQGPEDFDLCQPTHWMPLPESPK